MSPTSDKKLQKSDTKQNVSKLEHCSHEECKGKKVEKIDVDKCVHHWTIAAPNGTISVGHCVDKHDPKNKTCHDTRDFRNSFEYSSWYGSKSPQDLDSQSSAKTSGKSSGKKSG